MTTDRNLQLHGACVPRLLYGTAWKEERSQALTELAIAQGFRGIDTANQRRHYDEAAVGRAISTCLARGIVARDQLFLQTKFTFCHGQDHRLPYDPHAPISSQVQQSFCSSLQHLNVACIDSYVLHGPSSSRGFTGDDWAAWRSMESLHDDGRARMLGVSNVTLDQLQRLCDGARIPPSVVQNRCYAATGWDQRIRGFCAANGIAYQGFSLLTANRNVLANGELARMAANYGRTVPQIVFRFAIEIGILALTGTTNPDHMRMDLDIFDFRLTPAEIAWIEALR